MLRRQGHAGMVHADRRERLPVRRRRQAIVLAGAVSVVATAAGTAAVVLGAALVGAPLPHEPAARGVVAAPLGLPLRFEPNIDQAGPAVRFLARGPQATLYLTPTEAIIALIPPDPAVGRPDILRMRLLGANRSASVTGSDPGPGAANYLLGGRPSRWLPGVPTYGRATYRDVYPGIDLSYHGTDGQLEYDFEIAPGADPSRIELELQGARDVRLDPHGRLHVELDHRTLVQDAPQVYRNVAGIRRPVAGRYVQRGARRLGFVVGR